MCYLKKLQVDHIFQEYDAFIQAYDNRDKEDGHIEWHHRNNPYHLQFANKNMNPFEMF